VGHTHYLLRALAEKGLIKIRNFTSSKNKMHYSYLLTAQGLSEKLALTLRFLERNRVEYEALKAEIASLEEHLETGGNIARHTEKASK
jgi:EPS-associated MarR family transcriptional regulator